MHSTTLEKGRDEQMKGETFYFILFYWKFHGLFIYLWNLLLERGNWIEFFFIGTVGSCLWLLIKFQPKKKKVRKCKEMWCLILWDKENSGEFFFFLNFKFT